MQCPGPFLRFRGEEKELFGAVSVNVAQGTWTGMGRIFPVVAVNVIPVISQNIQVCFIGITTGADIIIIGAEAGFGGAAVQPAEIDLGRKSAL